MPRGAQCKKVAEFTHVTELEIVDYLPENGIVEEVA